jgi:protein tyrosine phosphatase
MTALLFIKDFYGKSRYIAAQGPINESVEDFIRMIWEFQITSIICTANENEGGRVSTFVHQRFNSTRIMIILY